jgi:hypothetical protein
MSMECRDARRAIGGDPNQLPPEVLQHLAGCPACATFRDETLRMEGRLRAALELPLHRFRQPAAPARRFAMAASVLLAVLVGGGLWLLRLPPALAQEIVEHVIHEPESWEQQRQLSPAELSAVFEKAGVRFDSRLPVVYAAPCPFRGRRVSHLVVQTGRGPMTVMLLPHVPTRERQPIDEAGYRGVLLPHGAGSIALVMRGAALPDAEVAQVLDAVSWR